MERPVEQGPLAARLSGRRGDLGNAGWGTPAKRKTEGRDWQKGPLQALQPLQRLNKGEGMRER